MFKPQTASEQVLFTTIRIEGTTATGSTAVGTGFFYHHVLQDGARQLPLILTNKHVVEGVREARFQLHETVQMDGTPGPSGRFFTVTVTDFERRWLPHPNPAVDLCAMPCNPLFEEAQRLGRPVFYKHMGKALLPSSEALEQMSAVKDVLMVGYPIGLWDVVNNLPIVRRGITATHPSVDFCGNACGVVDIACFPGSSGSPVLIVNESMFSTKQGNFFGQGRLLLLGVLYAGPFFEADGTLVPRAIPTTTVTVPRTGVPSNLGYYVKAREIHFLCEHVEQAYRGMGAI